MININFNIIRILLIKSIILISIKIMNNFKMKLFKINYIKMIINMQIVKKFKQLIENNMI